MIFGDWIGRWGRSFPETEGLVDAITGRRYNYGEMADDIHRLANFLSQYLGVVKGERVCCLSYNRVEYIFLFFALSRLGAVLVPLNFRLAPKEFIYFIEDSAPRAFFFDSEHKETATEIKARVGIEKWVCLDDDDSAGLPLPRLIESYGTSPPPLVEITAGDPQLIIYTSGTTGLPKGVILTHGMIEANSVNTILGWDLASRNRTILHSAMFYTAGWNVLTLPVFLSRGTNILVQSFAPDFILDLIGRENVTIFFGVPTMYQMMMDSPGFENADFSSVRFMVSGGAPLGRKVFETFMEKKGIRLREGYGLTEAGPNNFLANGKPGTLGHPMPGVDVMLADSEGNEVPHGETGEILLYGRHICAGYWNKPEATDKAIVNGWFNTGDLGRIDDDGHYSIAGRLKDMFISGGINIYPAEIENIIESHPDVTGAAVIGVPDEKWGEVGKAVLELRPGSDISLEKLNEFLEDRIGKFKRPKYLKIVNELPRTPASGKVQKYMLKKNHGGADNE